MYTCDHRVTGLQSECHGSVQTPGFCRPCGVCWRLGPAFNWAEADGEAVEGKAGDSPPPPDIQHTETGWPESPC